MFFLVRIDSVQQNNKIDCSLLAMTAFNKKSIQIRCLSDSTFSCLEFSYICLFLDKKPRGFRFLHLNPGNRVPGSGTRTPCTGPRVPDPGSQIPVPDSRIHLSILGRNQGLKNYTDLFRLWTFFRSDLIDVNNFGMSCTFLACLHGCIFEICSFKKIIS